MQQQQQHEVKAGRRASRRQSRLLEESKPVSVMDKPQSQSETSLLESNLSTSIDYRNPGDLNNFKERKSSINTESTSTATGKSFRSRRIDNDNDNDNHNDNDNDIDIDTNDFSSRVSTSSAHKTSRDVTGNNINNNGSDTQPLSKPFSGMSRRKMSQVEQQMYALILIYTFFYYLMHTVPTPNNLHLGFFCIRIYIYIYIYFVYIYQFPCFFVINLDCIVIDII